MNVVHSRKDILANPVATGSAALEGLYVQLNLRNSKCLLNCSDILYKNMREKHLAGLSTYLDSHSSSYEKNLILRDFNAIIKENQMKFSCDMYGFHNLIKQPSCYKILSIPISIMTDLNILKLPASFLTTPPLSIFQLFFSLLPLVSKRHCLDYILKPTFIPHCLFLMPYRLY